MSASPRGPIPLRLSLSAVPAGHSAHQLSEHLSGNVVGVILRLVSGAATAADVYVASGQAPAAPSAKPADELLAYEATAVALTASATESSLRDAIATPFPFSDGLYLHLNQTGGASEYEVVVAVDGHQ